MKDLTTLSFVSKRLGVGVWVLGLILLAFSMTVNAQGTAFLEAVPAAEAQLKSAENNSFMHHKNREIYKDVILVNTQDLSGHQENQVVPFRIPGIKGVVRARAKKIEALTKEDYLWTGEVIGGHEGSVILRAEKGKVYGHLRIDGQPYQLFSIKPGLSAMTILDREPFIGQEICDLGTDTFSVQPSPRPKIQTRHHCGPIRVMVLATEDARDALGGFNAVSQMAQTGIDQLNDCFDNSNINAEAELATGYGGSGVKILTGFNEPSNIVDALDDLPNAAANWRDFYFADVVVLLAESYNGAGLAEGIGPNNAHAVVSIDLATDELVIAHEIGHLLGGRHEECNDPNRINCDPNPGPAHAHTFQAGGMLRSTVMRSNVIGDVISHFSNPNVNFSGVPTGIANARHNAQAVAGNECTVAGYRDDPIMRVNITGPIKGYPNIQYDWCATQYFCSGYYEYLWEYSIDGFNYFYWHNGICKTDEIPQNYDLRLRLTGDCIDGQSAVDYHTTLNMSLSFAIQDVSAKDRPLYRANQQKWNVEIYPNPVSGSTIHGTLEIPRAGEVEMSLTDPLGRTIREFNPIQSGSSRIDITESARGLAPGIYTLRARYDNEVIVRKIVVSQ